MFSTMSNRQEYKWLTFQTQIFYRPKIDATNQDSCLGITYNVQLMNSLSNLYNSKFLRHMFQLKCFVTCTILELRNPFILCNEHEMCRSASET